jgi:hypothetical protein
MISANMDLQGLDKKIDKMRRNIREAAIEAIQDGYFAAVAATPAITGNLRASWYIETDGSPGSHPNPPDPTEKRELADERPFRRLPFNPPRRNVFTGDDEEGYVSSPSDSFISIYMNPDEIFDAALTGYVTLSNPFARTFVLVNNAEYAQDVYGPNAGYSEDARYAANGAIRARLAQEQKLGWGREGLSKVFSRVKSILGV